MSSASQTFSQSNFALSYDQVDDIGKSSMHHEIVFISSDIADVDQLISGLPPGLEVHLLDPHDDGLAQIARIMSERTNVGAVHVFSHGTEGKLNLGNIVLDTASLGTYSDELATIRTALRDDADLLLYGCEVGAGTRGMSFLGALSNLTGADVAASSDMTGAVALGGNWVLEQTVGHVATATMQALSYNGLLGGGTIAPDGSQADFTNYGQSFEDGEGGSTDIPGLEFQIFFADGSTHASMGDVKVFNNVEFGLGPTLMFADNDAYADELIVKTQSGAEFRLTSLVVQDMQNGAGNYTALGYKDGVQVASQTFINPIVQSGSYSAVLTFDNQFQNVDEVRLTTTAFGGQMWEFFTNFVVADAVVPAAIASATYDAASGVLAVTGTGITSGGTIDVSKLSLTGQGGSTVTLTSGNVTASSSTAFSVTLNAADKLAINGLLNKAGSSAVSGTTYNLAAASGWDVTAGAAADLSGNGVIVSNVASPSITSATYNAATNVLSVTGADLVRTVGANNDVTVSTLTLTGEDGASYQLSSANVEVASATAFSVTLNATDQAQVERIFNKNGTASTGGTTYRLAAADDWNSSINNTDTSVPNAAITVSNVAVPAITSASYNAATGVLVVSGSGFSNAAGTTNDIVASAFTFTGDGATYSLTDSANVEITSGTAFTLTLSATDRAAINQIVNKNGTASTGGTIYNLAAAEDWMAGADAAVVVADAAGNGITASNVATPTIVSATYDAATGALVVTGTGFLTLSGAANDIVANKFTFAGEGGATYALTDTANVEITSGTAFTLTLSAADQAALDSLLGKNGTAAPDGTTYNLAAGEDWMAGADAAAVVVDPTGNGITVSNVSGLAITGTPTQAQTLTATHTLGNVDGQGITYQWKADGADISGATSSTLVLGQDHVGKAITVVAHYTNQQGTAKAPVSSPTAAVANINDLPTGTVTITGTQSQGQTLTASNDLADIDGMGSVTYQWQADGSNLSGQTNGTLVLGQEHVGKVITVLAKYTDQQGMAEAPVSAATAAIVNVNDAPSGSVAITGTPTQGQTLAASHTLADVDGMGTVSYQWQADGADIDGATKATLALDQAQVGKAITVVAKYIDQQGTAEAPVSAPSAAVANLNDLPTGDVGITGTASEGQTLTASNNLADIDGMGTVTYQWKAGGVDIPGATGNTFVLTGDQIGKTITVVATYTDQQNTAESKESATTTAVTNVNAAPTGTVGITGTAKQGETLTASNDLADIDGMGSVTYQWQADGSNLSGQTNGTLVLGQEHVGKVITVLAKYTDQQGTAEAPVSAATAAIVNVNDAPSGSVAITGTPTQGQTLAASHTLADVDGMGTVSYQWQADGADIAGATKATLALEQAQVGKAITVVAKYTDQQGTVEIKSSASTIKVVEVNDKPTLTATGTTAGEYVSGNSMGVALFSNVAMSTVESGQAISEIIVRASGMKDAGNETLTIDGKSVALVTGTTVVLDTGRSAEVSVVGGALQVTVTNVVGWSVADANALIEGIQYKNTAPAPTLSEPRTFEITSVKDNGGAAHGGSDTAVVSITSKATVVAPEPAPVLTPPAQTETTIDGVKVLSSLVTNPDGSKSQTLTIPVVTPTRSEEIGNNTVADIPLVKNANGTAVLTAQVPTGLGLTIAGSTDAKAAGNSLTDLIREIKAHTETGSFDQNQLTGGGTGFLADLSASTPLLVQTIVPTSAIGTIAPGQALVINGTPTAPSAPMLALVIDARALPDGTNIQLNNVEFAAVIGNVRVTGGDGSQNVWGDGASQVIMLGADDDVLHGGAGNDTVGSAGGNDKVYGDEGNDLVFGGIGNDLVDGGTGTDIALMTGRGRSDYSFRMVDGQLTMTHIGGGSDGIDTIANVETLRFATSPADTSIRGTVGRLYEAVSGKAADFKVTEQYIDAYQKGMSVESIARTMLGLSTEQAAMSNEAFIKDLYENVLHRAADEAGFAVWMKSFERGQSRENLALAFANSTEKLAMGQFLDLDFNKTDVATLIRMYSALLGRAPDEAGLNFWISQYEGGRTLSSIADGFVSSVESIGRYSIGSNADFVNALYKTALHRDAQASEVKFWVESLNSGSMDRGDVLLGFADSAEKIELVGVITTSFETL